MTSATVKACSLLNNHIRDNCPESGISYHPETASNYPVIVALKCFLEELSNDVNELDVEKLRDKYTVEVDVDPIKTILEQFQRDGDIETAASMLREKLRVDFTHQDVEAAAKAMCDAAGGTWPSIDAKPENIMEFFENSSELMKWMTAAEAALYGVYKYRNDSNN